MVRFLPSPCCHLPLKCSQNERPPQACSPGPVALLAFPPLSQVLLLTLRQSGPRKYWVQGWQPLSMCSIMQQLLQTSTLASQGLPITTSGAM